MANKLLDFYLFETTERIARFVLHLEDIHKQFYSNDRLLLKDKQAFIYSYEECMEKLTQILIIISTKRNESLTSKSSKAVKQLEHINIVIKNLQQELLIHLPRPIEPIELRRFFRVIRKQILKLEGQLQSEISIYVNETTEDNSFATDPLENYKQEEINSLIDSNNFSLERSRKFKIEKIKSTKNPENKEYIKNIHISIPRLEANNPCHWPTLLHEVSHNLMKNEWFCEVGIENDFKRFLEESGAGEINVVVEPKINIESWLIECWCDLFACALIGPSFYFSQCAVFLHSLGYNKNDKYPPNHFRLKLISRFIEHRFKNLTGDDDFTNFMEECDSLLEFVDSKNNMLSFKKGNKLTHLFMLFNQYFINEFFILRNETLNFKHPELSALFKNINPFVKAFDITKLNKLVEALNSGFPIPSFRNGKEKNLLFEEANYVQEIFLASWLFRNGIFKQKILDELKKIKKLIKSGTFQEKGETLKIFKEFIVKEFDRFDQSILRSIQVSEWVDLLVGDEILNKENNKISKFKLLKTQKGKLGSLLVDKNIYENLKNNTIRIIPLININEQLGSTSLDIRLGTSFEVFYPNQFGFIDFTNEDAMRKVKNNSKNYNLDFLESIPINPGQFVLGHSMEYIKLPNNISADLEGRSSFARLGIEIHMTAGFVDPGFDGVLTFEIFNAGTNPIMLYPGLRIGQLRFMNIDNPIINYSQRQAAKYNRQLEHHFSLHGQDYEVGKIAEAIKKDRNLK